MKKSKQQQQHIQKEIVNLVQLLPQQKIQYLLGFLEKRKLQRICVVFWTQQEAEVFISELFLHQKLNHSLDEQQSKNITLLSSKVSIQFQYDWLIYFDPPLQIQEISIKNTKNILIFFLIYQQAIKDRLSDTGFEVQISSFNKCVLSSYLLEQIDKLTQKNYQFYTKAFEACKAYLIFYSKIPQEIFEFSQVNPYNISQIFGLETPPKVTNYVLKKSTDYKDHNKVSIVNCSKKIKKVKVQKQIKKGKQQIIKKHNE